MEILFQVSVLEKMKILFFIVRYRLFGTACHLCTSNECILLLLHHQNKGPKVWDLSLECCYFVDGT